MSTFSESAGRGMARSYAAGRARVRDIVAKRYGEKSALTMFCEVRAREGSVRLCGRAAIASTLDGLQVCEHHLPK